jgi:hypothetical protein
MRYPHHRTGPTLGLGSGRVPGGQAIASMPSLGTYAYYTPLDHRPACNSVATAYLIPCTTSIVWAAGTIAET